MKTASTHTIKKALAYTDDQMNNSMLDTGMGYLEVYMADDEQGRTALMSSRLFWKWWVRQWHKRCERFALENLEQGIVFKGHDLSLLRTRFSIAQDPWRIKHIPPRYVREDAVEILKQLYKEQADEKDGQAV